jgi:hypothetical protein
MNRTMLSRLLLTIALPAVGLASAVGVAAALNETPSAPPKASVQLADVSGPCDEAEHVNDPRCTGATPTPAPAPAPAVTPGVTPAPIPAPAPAPAATPAPANRAVDISGPCDEAEHANDPRCTGATGARSDDRSDDHGGRGRGRGGDDNRSDDNHSNDNRSDDSSGRGRGGDDD